MSRKLVKQYDEVQLLNAIIAVQNGSGVREASRQYGVPKTTLSLRVRRNTRGN